MGSKISEDFTEFYAKIKTSMSENKFEESKDELLNFISNNPDSIIVPIGNLIQNYINNISNYNDGILIGLEANQYTPIFNFNNIVIDTLRPPALELYYFK